MPKFMVNKQISILLKNRRVDAEVNIPGIFSSQIRFQWASNPQRVSLMYFFLKYSFFQTDLSSFNGTLQRSFKNIMHRIQKPI